MQPRDTAYRLQRADGEQSRIQSREMFLSDAGATSVLNRKESHRSSPPRMEQNDIFRALADPARRQVLALLREGEKNAGDLSAHFNLGKPAMSYHFSVLKGSGLILSHRDGAEIWYCLNREVLLDIRSWVVDLVRNSK